VSTYRVLAKLETSHVHPGKVKILNLKTWEINKKNIKKYKTKTYQKKPFFKLVKQKLKRINYTNYQNKLTPLNYQNELYQNKLPN
jgi:hypothetical protein